MNFSAKCLRKNVVNILRSIVISGKKRKLRKKSFPNKKSSIGYQVIPLSPKLRKVFKKAGYEAVFQAGKNLNRLLTSKSKLQLEPNSSSDIYELDCYCGKIVYWRVKKENSEPNNRTSKKILHTFLGKWDNSALSLHTKTCHGQFNLHSINNTVQVEERTTFQSKSKRSSRDTIQQVFSFRQRIKS